MSLGSITDRHYPVIQLEMATHIDVSDIDTPNAFTQAAPRLSWRRRPATPRSQPSLPLPATTTRSVHVNRPKNHPFPHHIPPRRAQTIPSKTTRTPQTSAPALPHTTTHIQICILPIRKAAPRTFPSINKTTAARREKVLQAPRDPEIKRRKKRECGETPRKEQRTCRQNAQKRECAGKKKKRAGESKTQTNTDRKKQRRPPACISAPPPAVIYT